MGSSTVDSPQRVSLMAPLGGGDDRSQPLMLQGPVRCFRNPKTKGFRAAIKGGGCKGGLVAFCLSHAVSLAPSQPHGDSRTASCVADWGTV